MFVPIGARDLLAERDAKDVRRQQCGRWRALRRTVVASREGRGDLEGGRADRVRDERPLLRSGAERAVQGERLEQDALGGVNGPDDLPGRQ